MSDDDDTPDSKQHVKIRTIEHVDGSKLYSVDFSRIISDELLYYEELFHILRFADIDDEMHLYLNSNGGDADVALQIMTEIKNSKMPVCIHVRGDCYSAGAMIAVSGTSLDMAYGTFLMFHNYSNTYSEKGAALMQALSQGDTSFKRRFKLFCSPFLTDKEITAIFHDRDIYVSECDDNFQKRIKRHFLTKRGEKQ